jgi:site-specific DNA-methyltransferase (adenine-specific)
MDTTLHNGDAMEVLKQYKDETFDLIVTDPPYKVTSKGSSGSMGGIMATSQTKKGKIFTHNDCDIKVWSKEIYRVQKDSTALFVMTNHVNLQEYLNILTDVGYKFIKSLIWNKKNKITSRYFMNQFEYILFFRKGSFYQINDCGVSDILEVSNIKTKVNGENIHPTEKPVKLMEILIENASQKGDVVLDPFMGVGSVGIACKNLDRKFVGIELDTEYYNIAKNRITDTKTNDLEEW